MQHIPPAYLDIKYSLLPSPTLAFRDYTLHDASGKSGARESRALSSVKCQAYARFRGRFQDFPVTLSSVSMIAVGSTELLVSPTKNPDLILFTLAFTTCLKRSSEC